MVIFEFLYYFLVTTKFYNRILKINIYGNTKQIALKN